MKSIFKIAALFIFLFAATAAGSNKPVANCNKAGDHSTHCCDDSEVIPSAKIIS